MDNKFTPLTDAELVRHYSAYRHGEIQLAGDELLALEEELAGRTIEDPLAWELLELLRSR